MNELAALRDVHVPPSPDWWAVPLWAFAMLAALLPLLFWLARRYRQRRGLRAALRELEALEARHEQECDATQLMRGVSRLLRRYAVTRFPQAGIEGLTDDAWLRFLDAHGGNGGFCGGPGAVLAHGPYQKRGACDTAPLLALVRKWLKAHPQ